MNDIENIDVFHFSGFCKELYDRGKITNDEIKEIIKDKDPNEIPIYEIHQRLLEKSIEKTGIKYDALVVDEGQDINRKQWDSLLWSLSDPYKNPVYIFHDNNQKVYNKGELDLPDFPKHPFILKKIIGILKIFLQLKNHIIKESQLHQKVLKEKVYHILLPQLEK